MRAYVPIDHFILSCLQVMSGLTTVVIFEHIILCCFIYVYISLLRSVPNEQLSRSLSYSICGVWLITMTGYLPNPQPLCRDSARGVY